MRERIAKGKYVEPGHLRFENILKFGKAFIRTFPFEIVGRKRNKFVIKMGGAWATSRLLWLGPAH